MDKKKITLIIEIVLFICALGLITFIYYFSGKETETEEESNVNIIKITDENFESEVLKSDKPVILEFYSNMCPPCLTMVPTMINIAKNNEGIKVATANSSDSSTEKISKEYNIDATPTILIFKDGELKQTLVGATSEENIMKEIK